MQDQLERSVDHHYIGPLLDRLQAMQERLEYPLPWMTLQPRVPADWEQVLHEHIENLDDEAIGATMSLGTTEGKFGCIEVCRIIYHILKDRKAGVEPSNGWLIKACKEAFEAIRNPQAWDGPKGKGKRDRQGPRVPTDPDDSSSSSGAWVTGFR